MARVPEEVDGPVPGEVLADGSERRLRLLPERRDVEGEGLVKSPVAEVRLLQRDGVEHRPARVDVLAVPAGGPLDHLGRAVDRGDRSRRQPLADQETATPWPQPTSSRRSAGRTSSVSTAQTNRSEPCPPCPSNSISRP